MDLPESTELLHLQEQGLLEVYFSGFGIDTLNGAADIALAAIIYDEEYAGKLEKSIETNWEVAESSMDNKSEPLVFIDYKDSKLHEWLINNEYQPGSAFALAETLKLLDGIMRNRP